MNECFAITSKLCYCSIINFYDNIANQLGEKNTGKIQYDCKKIHVSKAGLKKIMDYYLEKRRVSNYTIAAMLIQFVPKADLISDDYEVEIEDGFIIRGE
jgi:hypothetical protein